VYFITRNEDKFREVKSLLPGLERLEIGRKNRHWTQRRSSPTLLQVARKKQPSGPIVAEDTSLYLDGLNGFPGPLIKWMLRKIGTQGIYELCQSVRDRRAVARTVVGYDDGRGVARFFEAEVQGQIVAPQGVEGFGWDEIFQPDGLNETFAEMGDDYKSEFSMRTQAFRKLREYLAQ